MRIIDADSLSEEILSLTVNITGLRAGKGILANFMEEYRKSVLRIIEEQPTAYDVEKVVEQIKKSATDDDGLIVRDGTEPMIWKSKAIEIVRKGGVE